jgi:hypothetical protein
MKSIIRSIQAGMILFFITIMPAFGQVEDIGLMLTGGVDDAEQMLTEYLRPFANALGANINGGWYNTAKVHNLGGFDITFTASVAFVPDDHKTYDLSQLTLAALYDDNIANTVAGGKDIGPELSYQQDILGNPVTYLQYDHPAGTGVDFIPSPMINAAVGLPKGFEIMGRYMPTVNIGDIAKAGIWGVGFKHDVKQWIPVLTRIPVLNLSVMYGYTNIKVNTELTSITPDMIGATDLTTDNVSFDDQNFDVVTQGHTANALVSANLPVVCFYGGVGVSITQTNLKLNGYYPVPTIITDPSDPNFDPSLTPVVRDEDAIKHPIDVEIKNQDGGTTKPRLNAGVRFKFAVITLHVDYTWANYSVATAGIGVNIR